MKNKEKLPALVNCNKCKAIISRKEFKDGMGECLKCFPSSSTEVNNSYFNTMLQTNK